MTRIVIRATLIAAYRASFVRMADDRDFKTPQRLKRRSILKVRVHGRNDDANVEFGPERRQPRLVGEIRGIRPPPPGSRHGP